MVGIILQFYFYQHWIKQFYKKGKRLGPFFILTDIMGILKLTQLCLSVFVTYDFISSIIKGGEIFGGNTKLEIYAVLCFIMWFRMYYLMKAYDDRAHYITLIS